MKRYEGCGYKARYINGNGYLVTNSDTLEGIKEEIDESNYRAEKLGYSATSWMITFEEWITVYNDDGVFVKSEIFEEAIEVYPAE